MAYDEEKARLERENLELRHKIEQLEHRLAALTTAAVPAAKESPKAYAVTESLSNESLYQAIKKRLIDEVPAVLRLLVVKPQMDVIVERRTLEAKDDTLRGKIASLIPTGFFESPRAGTAVEAELRRQAFACSRPNVYRELDKIAGDGFLTKEEGGYQVVDGMKVNIVEAE